MKQLRVYSGRAYAWGFITVAFVLMISGCATVPPAAPADWSSAPTTAAAVTLQPGDTISVQFPYWSELDQEQSIRPDGNVAMKLVGTVQAGGLTPEELKQKLLELYADKVINPEITVVVTAWNSNYVYVGGEVLAPGVIKMQKPLTALEAVMQAGGFIKWSARRSEVVVIRQENGKRIARSIDLRKSMESAESDLFYLQPFDIVFVPRTRIEQLDQWVDQYLNKLVPDNVFVNFNFNKSFDDYTNQTQTFQVQTPTLK